MKKYFLVAITNLDKNGKVSGDNTYEVRDRVHNVLHSGPCKMTARELINRLNTAQR